MADEQKPKGRKKPVDPETKESTLTATPKAKGSAAAKVAPPVEAVEPAPTPHTKSTKVPKFEKKNKSRLPRRQKKALQKAAAAKAKV
jgi:hypothetical protein